MNNESNSMSRCEAIMYAYQKREEDEAYALFKSLIDDEPTVPTESLAPRELPNQKESRKKPKPS